MANGNSEPLEHRRERNHYFDVLLNTAERLNRILIFSQLEVHIDLIDVIKMSVSLMEKLIYRCSTTFYGFMIVSCRESTLNHQEIS